MKNIYSSVLAPLTLFLFVGCSKDILKPYDDRIVGVWEITNINKFGIGNSNSISFYEGDVFNFLDNGQLTYNSSGNTYNGSWDIRKDYTDEETSRSLKITAVDFNSQDVRSEFFDNMSFTGTNKFKAFIHSGTYTYVFHFSRQ